MAHTPTRSLPRLGLGATQNDLCMDKGPLDRANPSGGGLWGSAILPNYNEICHIVFAPAY
jgi:hypothetical protein